MLGLGFMFFEITLIQRLILFLGFPTYSLSVTLASILIFTGVGSLLSPRLLARCGGKVERTAGPLAGAIVVLGAIYLLAVPELTDAMLSTPLWVRIATTFVLLAPLGVCLGMFMPLGLGAVSGLTDHGAEYVAWSWAVNGFASVVGSVLTTLIAMSFGFDIVLVAAVWAYLIALVALRGLRAPIVPTPV
jgi:MFS family permease